MARLTSLPDTEPDPVDPGTTDSTRPEPRASTPPTSNATPPTTSKDNPPDDTNQSNHSIQPSNTPIVNVPSTLTTPSAPPPTESITYIARSDQDLIAALRLISDSVAQQRQLAAKALLTHPVYWSCLLLTIPYFYVEWYHDSSDWPLIIVVWVGTFTATLAVIKWIVHGYLDAAERVGRWSWLYGDQWLRNRFGWGMNLNLNLHLGAQEQAKNHETEPQIPPVKTARVNRDLDFKTDYVFVTKLGDCIIAALVVRLKSTWALSPIATATATPHPLKAPAPGLKGDRLQKKAIIRAWTVERPYRRNGVGIALLRFVVRWCLDNGTEGPEFAESHAHSLRLLPDCMNKEMDALDRRARETLYWEIQHYVSVRGWQVEEEGVKGDALGSAEKKECVARQGEGGLGVGDWFGPGSGPRAIISPKKRVQMSRAITRQILKGE